MPGTADAHHRAARRDELGEQRALLPAPERVVARPARRAPLCALRAVLGRLRGDRGHATVGKLGRGGRRARRGGPRSRVRGSRHGAAVHQHHAQGRRPGPGRAHRAVAAHCRHDRRAVATAGRGAVGLLGTAFTMEQSFYRDRLATPWARSRRARHRTTARWCTGSSTTSCASASSGPSPARIPAVIGRLVGDGADGVILGCTEIELLIDGRRQPGPGLPDHPAARGRRGRPGPRRTSLTA